MSSHDSADVTADSSCIDHAHAVTVQLPTDTNMIPSTDTNSQDTSSIIFDHDIDVINMTNLRLLDSDIVDIVNCSELESCVFRQNWLTKCDLSMLRKLTEIDLYENKITDLNNTKFPPSTT